MTEKERLEQLELLVAELLQKADRNSEDLANLSTRVVRLENKQDSLTRSVSQIIALMTRQSENIEYLLQENISIKEDIKNLKQGLRELREEVKQVRDEVKQVRDEVKQVSDEVKQVRDEVKAEIKEVREELKEVKAEMRELGDGIKEILSRLK